MNNAGCYIDGSWQSGAGEVFSSVNPGDGTLIWQGKSASADQVNQAFAAAHRVAPAWAQMPMEQRLGYIHAFKAQLEECREQMAETIAKETGKVLWDAMGEVGAMIGKIDLSIAAYEERTGERTTKTPFGTASLRHRPHGAMAVLGPYNFPAHLPNGHIVPALIAGDTIVFKPSELTPLTAELMCELWHHAELPDGVLNLVQGARDTGGAVLDHALLDGVLFTGSAQTGAFIHKKFGGRPEIMLALEMGGNNPLVVWDVSDVEAAANLTVQSAFSSTGQRCTCARRLIIPQGQVGDQQIEAIVAQMDRLVIGKWDAAPDPFMGCLISNRAAQGVLSDQAGHIAKGATAIRAATQLDWSEAALKPGLLEMGETQVADEETFGPLLQIYRADSFDRAIQMANDTRFGLAAGLISDDPALWGDFTRKVRAGIVNFNRPTTGAASSLPFGGPGISGNHRPGAWYAADYCAWPMASQEAMAPAWVEVPGLSK